MFFHPWSSSPIVLLVAMLFSIQFWDALGQLGAPLLVQPASVVLHQHHSQPDLHDAVVVHHPHSARLGTLERFLGGVVQPHEHFLGGVVQPQERFLGGRLAEVDDHLQERFLGGALERMEQEHHEIHHDINERFVDKHCTKSDKFFGCCNQIAMDSAITDIPTLITDACKYPPADLSTRQKITLGYYFNEYVMCYADGNDNSKCCADAGVPSEVTYAFWTVNCQNLCRGDNPTLTANAAWDKCSPYKTQIYKCNEKGANLKIDSAAAKKGFCKNQCKHPFQWQIGACNRPIHHVHDVVPLSSPRALFLYH